MKIETPLFIIEIEELKTGSKITKEIVEKFHLNTMRQVYCYTLYHSHESGNAYLTYNETLMAIGPSWILEPFMDLRQMFQS